MQRPEHAEISEYKDDSELEVFEPVTSFSLVSTDSTVMVTTNLYPRDKKTNSVLQGLCS